MAGAGHGAGKSLGPQLPPKPTAAGLGTGTRPRGAAQAGRWVPPWGWVPHGPHWPHTGTSRPRAPLPPWQPLLHEAILSRRRRSERVTAPMAPSPPPTSRSGTNKRLRAMDGGAWKPGGEAERGGAVQDCIHIPTPGRGQNPAGSWGTPESPGPRHCPRPMAAGGRGDGRSCPAGRCPPCLGAGRHVPSCCRSQPKITTVPLPIRAAREACGAAARQLLCIAAGGARGGILHGESTPRGGGAGLAAPRRMQPPLGLRASRAGRTLALAAAAGRVRARSWGPAGLAKAAAGTRPRHARARALPRLSCPWTCPRLGGGSQARGPQCATKAGRALRVPRAGPLGVAPGPPALGGGAQQH